MKKKRPMMESTNEKTAAGKHWCRFRESRSIDQDRVWIFTDGSSTGWYGAVVLIDGIKIRRASAYQDAGPMRNVAAELRGLILGLQHAPKGRECVVVHDYLGVGAWMIGAWNANKKEAKALIAKAKVVQITRQLNLSFIHHGGHQKDDSDFTYWNGEADALCDPDRGRLGAKGFYDD